MSYDVDYFGFLSIEPPLTTRELDRLCAQEDADDRQVHIVRRDGMGTAVEASLCGDDGHEVESHLARVVNTFPQRTFSGFLQGHDNTGAWRLVVRDGKVHRIEPTWEA
ncbi:DUF6205 family protein [Embleya sp. MST-111070]|uniref:DUF6205 family protein n=1 Tax=Embleya sp. MST-111070 TaxID=3398231 RepID=UPI003F7411B8